MEKRYTDDASIERVRSVLANMYHDINNPLAIISGNAQLLVELARVMEVDEELMGPIEDIEAATQRLDDSLSELERLQEELPVAG